MNTNQLNAEELGSANSLPGIYIRGAVAVYAVAVAVFSQNSVKAVYGAALARTATVGFFGMIFNLRASTEATVTGSYIARVLVHLGAFSEVSVSSSFKAAVGNLARVYGKTSAFVVGRWTTYLNVTFKAVTEVLANLFGQSGYAYKVYARGTPTVTTLEAGFTEFGEYAPESRYIMVQAEDRKAVVV